MVRYNVVFAVALASACASQSGEERSATASASDTASGSEMSQEGTTMAAQPSDSTTYSSTTTTLSPAPMGTTESTRAASPPADAPPTSAAADATPRLKPPEPGTIGAGQPGASEAQKANDDQSANDQMANVDVEAIRSLLIREYPNRADTIRAMTITEDEGIVTLRGIVLDEGARPGIIAVVERTPGVKQVRDELSTRTKTQ